MNLDLYEVLALAGGLLGLMLTAAAVYTAWSVHKIRKNQETLPIEENFHFLLKWSVFDYAVLMVSAMGMLFLLADLIGMIRDHESYPLYHYGYLLCGFIFSFLGMVFMVIRLGMVLSLTKREMFGSPNHHAEPEQTHHAE